MNIKDRMFQYAYDEGIHNGGYSSSRIKIVEDTGLITEKEANELWNKYYPQVVKNLEEDERPQMVIWKDCKDITDYHTEEKEINYVNNLEVKNGKIYKVEKIMTQL